MYADFEVRREQFGHDYEVVISGYSEGEGDWHEHKYSFVINSLVWDGNWVTPSHERTEEVERIDYCSVENAWYAAKEEIMTLLRNEERRHVH